MANALSGAEKFPNLFKSADDAVRGKTVIVLGGDRAGLVVAERLAQAGNAVAVVDQGKKVAHDVIPTFKWRHIGWVGELGIEVLKETRALEVSAAGLHLEDANGNPSVRPFDALVVGGPRISENSLTRDLSFACDELYTVGDAVLPRNICDAVHEGYKTGVRI